jgi:hypothetical protein
MELRGPERRSKGDSAPELLRSLASRPMAEPSRARLSACTARPGWRLGETRAVPVDRDRERGLVHHRAVLLPRVSFSNTSSVNQPRTGT